MTQNISDHRRMAEAASSGRILVADGERSRMRRTGQGATLRTPQIRLIAPISISSDGAVVYPQTALRRGLLAVLAFQAGSVVSYERIQSALWVKPPSSARANIRTHLAALKRDFEELRIAADVTLTTIRSPHGLNGGGAMLKVDRERIDLLEIDSLASMSRMRLALDPVGVAEHSKRLMDRIGPFGPDLPETPWFREKETWVAYLAQSLKELCCRASLLSGDMFRGLDLARNFHAEVGGNFHSGALLVAASYLCDRTLEAVELIGLMRQENRELGLDVPPEIERLHTAILRHDRSAVHGVIAAM